MSKKLQFFYEFIEKKAQLASSIFCSVKKHQYNDARCSATQSSQGHFGNLAERSWFNLRVYSMELKISKETNKTTKIKE